MTPTVIEVGTYKFSLKPKSDGSVRIDTYLKAGRLGVGSWVVLNQDGSVGSSDRDRLPADDVMVEMRQALATYLTGEVPGAVEGAPAASLYALSDAELLKTVAARTGTPLVGRMGGYVLRGIRSWAKNPNLNQDEPTDAMLRDLVQEAWEDNAHRE